MYLPQRSMEQLEQYRYDKFLESRQSSDLS